MRTTLDLDEELVADLVRESGKRSKKAAVEEAAREYINARRRQRLIDMIGTFEIDLTLEDLWKMRGCDKARAANERTKNPSA